MKKFIYLLLLAATIVAAGCENNSNRNAYSIMGHTYRLTDSDGDFVSFYFMRDYTCVYSSSVNGEYFTTSHLTYKISGTSVDVYYDNSTAWKESARNALFCHMTYNASKNQLIWNDATLKCDD